MAVAVPTAPELTLVDTSEAAEILQVAPKTVRRYAADGVLPVVRYGESPSGPSPTRTGGQHGVHLQARARGRHTGDPPRISTAVPTWRPGDTIPLGPGKTLRVLELRPSTHAIGRSTVLVSGRPTRPR